MKAMRILVLMLLVAGVATYAQEDINERVPADPRGEVDISNIAGSVVVTGWNRDEVEVTGTLGRGSERLDVEAKGDRVIIKVVFPKGRNQNVKGSDLNVRVPAGSDLDVATVSATIEVSDVNGSMSLASVSGNVDVEGELEDLEIANVSGRITVDARFESGEFANVSGNIEAVLDLPNRGRCEFDSVSGNIYLLVPSGLGADFDISTFSGSIQSDFGPKPRPVSKYTPGKELSFSTGSGGARISANSFSGKVRIEEH